MGSCPPFAARRMGRSIESGKGRQLNPGVGLIESSHKVTVEPVSSKALTVWSPNCITALGRLSCGQVGFFQHIKEVRQVSTRWGNDLPTSIPRTRFPTVGPRIHEVDHYRDGID